MAEENSQPASSLTFTDYCSSESFLTIIVCYIRWFVRRMLLHILSVIDFILMVMGRLPAYCDTTRSCCNAVVAP